MTNRRWSRAGQEGRGGEGIKEKGRGEEGVKDEEEKVGERTEEADGRKKRRTGSRISKPSFLFD